MENRGNPISFTEPGTNSKNNGTGRLYLLCIIILDTKYAKISIKN
jgi:hypothetical protein